MYDVLLKKKWLILKLYGLSTDCKVAMKLLVVVTARPAASQPTTSVGFISFSDACLKQIITRDNFSSFDSTLYF